MTKHWDARIGLGDVLEMCQRQNKDFDEPLHQILARTCFKPLFSCKEEFGSGVVAQILAVLCCPDGISFHVVD